MTSERQRQYFAASNSADGFVNYFPQIFGRDRCEKLYVIKGGPGTGKSCFMRQVAMQAEKRGYGVTYYYCSSDPESLDGILIHDIRVGIIDGTAPHVWEPTSVGTFEQIVNLGEFWDEAVLVARKEEIETLSRKKSEYYRIAYQYLSAYGNIMRSIAHDIDIMGAVDIRKLSSAVERLVKKLPSHLESDFREEPAICDSIGMAGRVRFPTYEKNVTRLFSVTDCCGIAYLFFDVLYDCCRRSGRRIRVSRNAILPERIDALEFCDCGVAFVLCDQKGEGTVNMRRFIHEEMYKTLRRSTKEKEQVAELLLGFAEESFSQVRACHFALEAQFFDAMDFEAKERYTAIFCTKLFEKIRHFDAK